MLLLERRERCPPLAGLLLVGVLVVILAGPVDVDASKLHNGEEHLGMEWDTSPLPPLHRRVFLRSVGLINTLSEPQYYEDEKYSSYLNGGERKWSRIRMESTHSARREKHQYLIHFGEKSFVDLAEKSKAEKIIQRVGGCFASAGENFEFDKHSHYLAHNTFVVHCEENTIKQLKTVC